MKMKKLIFFVAGVFIASLITVPAIAGKGNNGLYGKHWQFNIIGHPAKNGNSIGGDNSNGRTIMVPLKNVNGNTPELICPEDGSNFANDTEPTVSDPSTNTFVNMEPDRARIYFEPSGDPNTFEIVDRDAIDDNEARIIIPSYAGDNPLYDSAACAECTNQRCEDIFCEQYQEIIAVDVWVRALGKPGTCMNINGWAYDEFQNLYFWSGRIELARKAGKSTWEPVSDIFSVWWCDNTTTETCADTEIELSVFNSVFAEYFWDVLNDGSRNVQVRLYPVTEY